MPPRCEKGQWRHGFCGSVGSQKSVFYPKGKRIIHLIFAGRSNGLPAFLSFILEVISIEVRINKEVRDYQESVFFGLSLRQLIFALLAVLVALGVYFSLRNIVGSGEIGWVCVLAAFPFALGGFFTYNGMTFEKFLLALIRSELLYPRKLVFRSENLYAKALENTSIKEALRLD